MPFNPFYFLEQFIIGIFLITLFQLEKTGSIGKALIPLEILKLKIASVSFAPFPPLYLESAIR